MSATQPLLGTAVPHIHSKHGASVHLRHVTSIIRIASACHSIAIFQFLVVAPVVFVGLAAGWGSSCESPFRVYLLGKLALMLPALLCRAMLIMQGNSALQISELGLDQTYGAVHVRAEAQKLSRGFTVKVLLLLSVLELSWDCVGAVWTYKSWCGPCIDLHAYFSRAISAWFMMCFFIRIASMVLLLLPFVRPPAHVLAKMRQSHGSDYAEGSVSLFDELIDVLFRLSDDAAQPGRNSLADTLGGPQRAAVSADNGPPSYLALSSSAVSVPSAGSSFTGAVRTSVQLPDLRRPYAWTVGQVSQWLDGFLWKRDFDLAPIKANLIAHGVDGARLLTMGEAEFRAVAGAGPSDAMFLAIQVKALRTHSGVGNEIRFSGSSGVPHANADETRRDFARAPVGVGNACAHRDASADLTAPSAGGSFLHVSADDAPLTSRPSVIELEQAENELQRLLHRYP